MSYAEDEEIEYLAKVIMHSASAHFAGRDTATIICALLRIATQLQIANPGSFGAVTNAEE
ncbi:hypothetical protein [Asticcacaulis taihuensis]|uniref:hypothetical protein n=1 Tax=Asticcacaulis taihuensis TaxID=260084 RepID=UPI0026E9C1D9|nr:hypothetical protein [Asticcacaulis taihuensis]